MDQVATFSSCTRSELDLLSFIGTEVAVEAGAVIMTENARSRECFVISSGRARVWRDGHDLGLIGTGEIFGEMSLLAGAPHPATVTAETPVELCVLSPAEFDSLMANAPSVIRKMMRERRRSLLS
jgi:CRP-like cAMP-binding protein